MTTDNNEVAVPEVKKSSRAKRVVSKPTPALVSADRKVDDVLQKAIKFIGIGFAWGFFWLGLTAIFAYSKSNESYNETKYKGEAAVMQPAEVGVVSEPAIPLTGFNQMAALNQDLNQTFTNNAKVDKPYILIGKQDTTANKSKTLIVFADPACPYCRKVERELKQLAKEGYEINIYPINALGRSAADIESLLCNEREPYSLLWDSLMNDSKIKPQTCKAGREAENANLALHNSLGFKSVPIIIAKSNGNYHVGDATSAELKLLFNADKLAK